MYAIHSHLARLGYLDQQQIQLLQRIWHPWQEPVSFPALDRWHFCFRAFAITLEATASDDALDLLDILITEIFSEATKVGEQARLRTLKDLDAAASQLGQACRVILDSSVPDSDLRAAILQSFAAR